MVRILNLFCVALMGLTILGLYRVSEATRAAHNSLDAVTHQIAQERADISVLQTEWSQIASPARIQQLAQSRLGMSDTASVQLSSFDLLPRRGDAEQPAVTSVHNASAVIASPAPGAPAPAPILIDTGM